MDNKTLNAQESIRIIEQTLERSARNLEDHSGKPLVFWGYLSVITSLGVHFLTPHLGPLAHCLWLLIPVVGYPLSRMLGISSRSPAGERGFVERFLRILWLVIGLSNSLVGIYLGIIGGQYLGSNTALVVLAYVCLSCTMAMLITGVALRIKAYQWGAVFGLVYLIASAVGLITTANYCLAFAALFFGQMCLVGHYLMFKNK